MYALFEHKEDLTALAAKLQGAGFRMAAEEVEREARLLGERAGQLAGVLDDYRQDIAAIQAGAQ